MMPNSQFSINPLNTSIDFMRTYAPGGVQPGRAESVASTYLGAGGLNFASMLQSALTEIDQAQRLSDEMTVAMLLGSVDIHQATIAMEKATLNLRTLIQVRDKMLEAYQEIMRMQV